MASIIKSMQFKRGKKAALESVLVGDKKPLAGEPIWESDTGKLKIGDGKHDYIDLPYLSGSSGGQEPAETSDIVLEGYYKNNIFYKDETCLNPLTRYVSKLYFDLFKNSIYYYSTDGQFHALVKESQIDGGIPGLIKLYGSTGQNEDGAMSQKAITDCLNKKVEIDLTESNNECVIFKTNI